MTTANEERGEVDLELDGTRFVLRPSYEAVIAVEKATGKGILALAFAAKDGGISLTEAGIVTAELVRAWGRSTGEAVAANVDTDRITELIHVYGLMRVTLRLAIVLTNAVTGGCKSDGSPKDDAEGEAKALTEGKAEASASASPGSHPSA
jgi:hypothetical protein